jgi:outer membrane protein TolC
VLSAGCTISPEPITKQSAALDALVARTQMFADQETISGPITLEMALARALRYNLDARVAMLEQATQVSQLNLLHYDMLPRLTANAGYYQRDRELVSSSRGLRTGRLSEDNTVSTDRRRQVADLTLSWNVLDFGTSYYQAKQQADRVLVARERRRRSINNIFQEITSAYWQAATAQRLLPRVQRALHDARRALTTSERLERERAQPLSDSLRYQRDLLDLIRQLETVAEDMQLAQTRLAQLMGLPPTTTYQVAAAKGQHYPVPGVSRSADDLERFALVSRPEVQEERYNVRIAQTETRRAMMRFLPSVNPFAMVAYDSNSYLVHNNWAEIGLRAGMNLLSLASLPTAQELAERQVELAQARKLAVSMAVVAQVHVALQQFSRAHRQFEAASRMERVERRLSALSAAGQQAQSTSELDRVRSLTSALAAELQRDRAYAELMNAHAGLHVALGLDPLPGEDGRDAPLETLAASIREVQASWWSGALQLPPVPDPPAANVAPAAPRPSDDAPVRN